MGRSKWKKLSRRNERRALNEGKGRTPRIRKFNTTQEIEIRPHTTMWRGITDKPSTKMFVGGGCQKPDIVEIEDDE